MSEKPSDTRVRRLFGFASLALYVAFGAFFWTRTLKSRWTDELVITIIGGALALLYFSGVKFAARATTSVILAFAAGIGVIGFLTPPFDSTDVFFYMATGWEQAHYGNNPYSVMLRNVDGAFHDPMINNAWMAHNRNPWLDIPPPYGFSLIRKTRRCYRNSPKSYPVSSIGHCRVWRACASVICSPPRS
jgi:hypothetical protein